MEAARRWSSKTCKRGAGGGHEDDAAEEEWQRRGEPEEEQGGRWRGRPSSVGLGPQLGEHEEGQRAQESLAAIGEPFF